MKLRYVAALTFLALMVAATPVKAENPAHVKQLLETNLCAKCDLSGANLSGAHIIGADLRDADLRGANLFAANLEGADLTGANLTRADLTEAYLTDASLNEANLTSVNFTRSQLVHTEARGAIIKDVTLTGANVIGTPISIGGD